MELILGTAGQPHVTSQQMREIFKMVVGSGSYILNSGEYIEPELQSNQALRIRSGILMHHGGIAEVKQNTYDEVTIGNGTQGMKRIDLVVARYTKDPETEHETMTWVAIQGTPAASDPVAPAYTEGDMQNGDLTDDCPVFEVHLDGIQVTEVVKLVEILDCDLSSLNGNNKVYKYAITVKPYPAANPGNTLTINIYKQNRMCIGYVSWLGSVSNNASIIGEFTVPTAFCPVYNVCFSAPAVTSETILSHGSTRFEIGTDGKLKFVTDEQGFVERSAAFAFLSNDIVPGDSYLQS